MQVKRTVLSLPLSQSLHSSYSIKEERNETGDHSMDYILLGSVLGRSDTGGDAGTY